MWMLWLALVSGLLGGFFAANHRALLEYSPSRLLELLQRRKREAWMNWLEPRDELILITAIYRSLFHLAVVIGMLLYLAPPTQTADWQDYLVAVLAAWVVIAVVGIVVPMSWGRHAAEPLLIASLPILRALYRLTHPLVWMLRPFDPIVRRLLGVPDEPTDEAASLEMQLLDAVSEIEKAGMTIEPSQKDMIEAIVDFTTTTVEQIMTPRTDVVGLESDQSMEQIKQAIDEHGHSRYPVFEGDLDHILGMLYAKDLLKYVGGNGDGEAPFELRRVVREALFVPETKPLQELLAEMQTRKVHIAVVLDEYGGTAGLVTIEDIVEEIVGEIQDEYETDEPPEPVIERVDARTTLVEGRVYIDDLNDELDIELPEDDDYDTVGGFVFSTLGHIPEVGESFDYENLHVTVLDAEKTRINQVRIEITGDSKTNGNGE